LATESAEKPIVISVWLWRRVILQLRRRGRGHSESGVFLLADQPAANRVKSFVCYDDLDPNAYEGGAIAFHAAGYSALWEHCRNIKQRVVADVHTHPGRSVMQSPIDQRNPMLPLQGHTALIVPKFGHTPWWTLDLVGFYEYLGNFKWRNHSGKGRKGRVILTPW
jgi:hypothetical protein